jgi:hypothetical protein
MSDESFSRTYVHKFKTGNTCTVKITLTSNNLDISATWENEPNWSQIRAEYRQWRSVACDDFINHLEPVWQVTCALCIGAGRTTTSVHRAAT